MGINHYKEQNVILEQTSRKSYVSMGLLWVKIIDIGPCYRINPEISLKILYTIATSHRTLVLQNVYKSNNLKIQTLELGSVIPNLSFFYCISGLP